MTSLLFAWSSMSRAAPCSVKSGAWRPRSRRRSRRSWTLRPSAKTPTEHSRCPNSRRCRDSKWSRRTDQWPWRNVTVDWNKAEQKFSKLYVFIITVSLKPDIIFKKYIINLMTEYKKAHNELTRYFKFNNCTILQTLYWLKYIISLESLPSLRRLTPGFHHLKHKTS